MNLVKVTDIVCQECLSPEGECVHTKPKKLWADLDKFPKNLDTYEELKEAFDEIPKDVFQPLVFIGLADCHGIESFVKEETAKESKRMLALLTIRAMSNRHRHALSFRLRLQDKQGELILQMVDEGDYEGALKMLKMFALDVELGGGGNVKKSWDKIPNPELDAYR